MQNTQLVKVSLVHNFTLVYLRDARPRLAHDMLLRQFAQLFS